MLVHRPLPTCSSPVMHHSPAPPASPFARRLDAATGEHLGSSHKLLVGRTSRGRVLAFGFLYNMRDHADHVIVTRVEEAVQQAWFVDALMATEYDAVLFLTHT